MRQFPICKEEVKFYEKVIKLLGWKEKNGELYKNMFPILVNGKKLIKLGENPIYDKNVIAFRPLRNNKHCQYLINYLFEKESGVSDILTIKNENIYSAKILDHHEEIMIEVDNCRTEVEAKFIVIFQFYFGDTEKYMKKIRQFDEEYYSKEKSKVKKTYKKL